MQFPESNTPKLIVLAGLQAMVFYAAFEKIFFQDNGLSIIEIAILSGIFSLGLICLEVPSGALSDRWIRKHVLSLSVIAAMATTIVFAVGSEFWHFAVGIAFAAGGFVLNSGTNTSILFDSLKEHQTEQQFEKYLAVRRIFSGIGLALGSLIGGVIAERYGIATTMWATLMPLLGALLITTSLREPHFHKTTGELNYFTHIRYAVRHLVSSHYFVQVIALSVMIKTVSILIEDYAQLYYLLLGFSLFAIGVLSFFEGIKEIVANYVGSYVSRGTALARLYGILLLVMAGSLLLSAWQLNIVGVISLFVASSMFFIIDVPLLGGFHRQLASGIRATAESFLNLATELSKVMVAIGFATVANWYSINVAFGVLGCVVLLYTVYYWLCACEVLEGRVG